MRGFDEGEDDPVIQDFRENSRRVNAQLDADLGKKYWCVELLHLVSSLYTMSVNLKSQFEVYDSVYC